MREVMKRLREQRHQAFKNVQVAVQNAITAQAGVPKELDDKYQQAVAELNERICRAESDTQKAEWQFAIVVSEVAKHIKQSRDTSGEPNARYGGPLGQTIFDQVIGAHTIPALTECLIKFVEDTQNLDYSSQESAVEAFLPALLDVAAGDRRIVAMMSGMRDAVDFGAKHPDRMHDAVHGWEGWESMMYAVIDSMLALDWRSYRSSDSSRTVSQFLLSVAQCQGSQRFARFVDLDDEMCLTFDVANVANKVTPPSGTGGLVPLSASDENSYYSFNWSVSEDDSKIQISNFWCRHPTVLQVNAIRAIAPHVRSALAWTSVSGTDSLQDSLLRILYKFSHSSTYLRGQASITEILMKSIALFHGIKLRFLRCPHLQMRQAESVPASAEGPAPQPDQHALAHFNEDRFVKKAIGNLIAFD